MKEAINGNRATPKSKLEGLVLRCIGKRDVETTFGAAKVYEATTESGEVVSFFGSPVIDSQEIQEGDVFQLVKIPTKDGYRKYWIAKGVSDKKII